ncbi:MAG: ABC transporter ATP-binding protein [Planctomycetota bacterium]|nr:ABC transporter ATP-binding protein [Planctomycetota bacterium]
MTALLVAEGLTKVFHRRFARGGDLCAVDDVSFTVHRGNVFGFLGPNGAGKSTTLRLILGLIYPTAGRVAIAGHDLSTDRLRALRNVGAFVEAPSFYPYLTGRKNLEIFTGLSGGVPAAEIDRVLELTGLKGREHEAVQVYSHGMKQRLGIAACLLPRPELLVLDEPTDGLDPHGIRQTRELIVHLARAEGLTIVLSSHLLSEVENLCNRVVILDRGRSILEGELAALERQCRRLEVSVDRPEKAAALLREKFGLAAEIHDTAFQAVQDHGQDARATGLHVVLDGTDLAAVNTALVQAGFAVRSLAPEARWLERIFLERTSSTDPGVRATEAQR